MSSIGHTNSPVSIAVETSHLTSSSVSTAGEFSHFTSSSLISSSVSLAKKDELVIDSELSQSTDDHCHVGTKKLDPVVLTDYVKFYLLNHHFVPSSTYQFPLHIFGKQSRHFQSNWLSKFNGLIYCKVQMVGTVSSVYCLFKAM